MTAVLGMLGCTDPDTGAGGAATATSSASDVSSQSVGPSSTTGAMAERLRVMAWNIETFPKSPQATDGVRQILTEQSPDLVGVVEITDTALFTVLAEELGYKVVFNQQDDFQRIGIMFRPERVTLSEFQTLFPGDGYAFPRSPLRAHVQLNGRPEVNFEFIVVHLKALLDQASEDRRRAACEQLDGWVREHVASGGDPDVAVVGDMNDNLTDPQVDNVFVPFLTAPERYRFLTLAPEQAGEFTYLPFTSFLDHVLVTRDMDAELGSDPADVLEVEQGLPGYVQQVSDHRPVAFELVLPP